MTPQVWSHVPIEDPACREVYDRHYSRQTVGAEGLVAPGSRFLFRHEGSNGLAIWAVVRNRFKAPGWDEGVWYFRNSIFRNESGTLSSDLIRAATATTYEVWIRRYGALPPEDLITEIDIDATAHRRGKDHPPGYCYELAGWEWFKSMLAGHGRPRKAVYRAPRGDRP
jgi:hypothetical protein